MMQDVLVKYFGLPSTSETDEARDELQKVNRYSKRKLIQISDESIAAYLEDIQGKPGSKRGCLASLLNPNDKENPFVAPVETITKAFIPLMRSGTPATAS
jgi:hypothetical protein